MLQSKILFERLLFDSSTNVHRRCVSAEDEPIFLNVPRSTGHLLRATP